MTSSCYIHFLIIFWVVLYTLPDSKDPRIDVNNISIRHDRYLIYVDPRSEGFYYLGCDSYDRPHSTTKGNARIQKPQHNIRRCWQNFGFHCKSAYDKISWRWPIVSYIRYVGICLYIGQHRFITCRLMALIRYPNQCLLVVSKVKRHSFQDLSHQWFNLDLKLLI